MPTNRYALHGELWLYQGKAGWYFLTLPKKQGADIKKRFGAKARGWRSLRAAVTIGGTRWLTSIFPDGGTGSYLLPVKAAVRKKEKLAAGKKMAFIVEILA